MTSVLHQFVRITLPVALAILISAGIFAASGFDVGNVLSGVLDGAITGPGAFIQTLRWSTPLLLIALGFMITYRTGEFNIGAQGQLMMGGTATVAVALLVPLPPAIVLPLALAAGIAGGALWSTVAGLLKLRFGTDEVISTLMLNFIAALFVQWITTGPLKDDSVRGDSAFTVKVADGLRLSGGTGFSWALLGVAVTAALVAWYLAERSSFGRKSRLVGSNPVAASWQGLKINRLRALTYLFAGAFAGLAGATEVLGPNGRLMTGATPSIGFTAIIVAIVGMASVPGIVVAALFFGALQAAILFLPIVSDLPTSGLHIVEGLIGLLVTARFIAMRQRRKAQTAEES